MANLVVVEGPEAGKSYAVPRSVLLGRQKGVDVLIDDVAASREHAKVFTQDGDWFVVDLGSRNGTKVNGAKISRWQLGHGDTITIGKTSIRFDAPDVVRAAEPAPAAPAAAGPAAPSAPKGPSPLEQERARLRAAAAASRSAPTGRMQADDGSGVVVRETVLQYGRIDDRGGLLRDDLSQRGGLAKIALALLFLGVGAGIVFGIVKAMEKDVVEDPNVPEAPAPAK